MRPAGESGEPRTEYSEQATQTQAPVHIHVRHHSATPTPIINVLESLFQGDRDTGDADDPQLPYPSDIVRGLFQQHAGRSPDEQELRPFVEYFAPYYRSACLHTEVVIRAYLESRGEAPPLFDSEPEADSDATRETDSSESEGEDTGDAPDNK